MKVRVKGERRGVSRARSPDSFPFPSVTLTFTLTLILTSSLPMTLPTGARLATHPLVGDVLELATPAGAAVIALHGATIISYVPTGARDLLWLSPKAAATPGKAIRGGVPLCGPWFGPHAHVASAPMHGLMRITRWSLHGVEALADGALRARFDLELPAQPEAGWPHAATARFEVTLGAALKFELTVRNTGRTPFLVSGALHTYFAVSDIRHTAVEGLAEREYMDYTGGGVLRRHGAGAVKLDQEAARFFLANAPTRIVDAGWNRAIDVSSWGAGATVVWNPWEKTGTATGDIAAHWPEFICVEAANIPATAVPLPPSQSHHLGQRIALSA